MNICLILLQNYKYALKYKGERNAVSYSLMNQLHSDPHRFYSIERDTTGVNNYFELGAYFLTFSNRRREFATDSLI